jgi:hypothetical protein
MTAKYLWSYKKTFIGKYFTTLYTERKHKIVPILLFRWVQMINDRERPFY